MRVLLTSLLLISATIIYQSLVHPDTPDNYTLCASMFGGEKEIHNAIKNNDDNHNHNHHSIIKSQYVFAIMHESKPADTSSNGVECTKVQI